MMAKKRQATKADRKRRANVKNRIAFDQTHFHPKKKLKI
jgi:hypothetical protein